MAINQAHLFLVFTLNGIFIGLLFDFFRILRKSFKTKNFVTYIEDILFWLLTGLSIIFSMYNFSGGSLRFFMFLGLGVGTVMYILTLSKLVIKTSVFIISIIKKIVSIILKAIITLLKILYNVLDKIIFRPLYLLYIKVDSFFQKKSKKMTNKILRIKKIEKNVKKT